MSLLDDDRTTTVPDQADGLRRLFAGARTRYIAVTANPDVAFSGLALERLAAACATREQQVLVVDAAAAEPHEMAALDLAACVEPLAENLSYLAARGLPLRHVDHQGSTAAFLQVAAEAAPHADVLLVHASASEHCRLFARQAESPRPLLLADDRPASVTHAYAGMKLLTQRAGLVVHDLLLGAAPHSPRAERIAMQLATCADDFLGAALRDWVRIDPASDATEAPSPELRRWVRERLGEAVAVAAPADKTSYAAERPDAIDAGALFYVDRLALRHNAAPLF
jgi:hypothetical protein